MAASVDNSCAVCLAEAKNPRQVPCGNGHVFCLSCLQGLVTHGKTVQNNSFPCPCCRKRVNIPPGGVLYFPFPGEPGPSPPPESPSRGPRLGNVPFPRRHPPPHDLPLAAFADRPDYVFPGPRPPPMLPFPGLPPRHLLDRMYPRRRPRADLKMDGPESHPRQDDHQPPYPPAELLYGPPALPPRPFDPGERQRIPPRRPRRPPAGSAEYIDLDMDEVMLVIAQMEKEEQEKLAQRELEQEEMLRMQVEVNEQEDQLEALGVGQDVGHH